MSDDSNATALHQISVMVDHVDKGATATVAFIHHYTFWFVLAGAVLLLSCIVSRVIDVAKTAYCLCSPCVCVAKCCCRRRQTYHEVGRERGQV